MRKMAAGALALGVLAGSWQAHAGQTKPKSVTFEALVPCTVVCSYWLPDPPDRIPFVAGDGAPYACNSPFPEGSYDQITVTAPARATLLRIDAFPVVDWDVYVCTPSGGLVAEGATAAVDCPYGCKESISALVKPGKKYVIRAYNWSDYEPLPAKYWFYLQ